MIGFRLFITFLLAIAPTNQQKVDANVQCKNLQRIFSDL